MKPTLEEIISYAESAAGTNYKKNRHSKNYNDTFNGIVKGAEWAISQMQPEWVGVIPEEINEIAERFASRFNFEDESYRIHCVYSVKYGFNEAIRQLHLDWVPVEPRTPELLKRLESTDARLIQCLFDNGEILAFNDNHPFAVMTHYCFLPQPPTK